MSNPLQDIVVQLRRGMDANDPQDVLRFENLAEEAADEIARLRKELAELHRKIYLNLV